MNNPMPTPDGDASRFRDLRVKCALAINVLERVKNWPVYFADYFALTHGPFVEYCLRGGPTCRLRAGSDDRQVFNDIFLRRVYCDESEIHEGDVVVDVGAHIGLFSLLAGSRGAKVISFEPFPENYRLLEENVALNGLQDYISPSNLAVWSSSDVLKLYLSGKNEGSNSVFGESREFVNVKATTLRQVFEAHRIETCRVLKIDAEGAEYPILYSTPSEILAKIDKISLEWHDLPCPPQPEYEHNRLKEFLQRQGFEVSTKPGLYVFEAVRNRGTLAGGNNAEND